MYYIFLIISQCLPPFDFLCQLTVLNRLSTFPGNLHFVIETHEANQTSSDKLHLQLHA